MTLYKLKICFVLVIVILVFSVAGAQADTIITGKVVGIADGDTITVLQNKTQYKIRLYGIDCPESHQDFGTKAKKFTSDLVFKKVVRVVQKDQDRYGRVVGIVYVGETCVNEQIVRSGFAWVYGQYCKDAVCNVWKDLELAARKNRIGLWSHPEPIPPWNFRRGMRGGSAAKNVAPQTAGEVVYHGNTSSMVFHQPSCKHYNCKNCTAVFKTREDAVKAGYRPCGGCKP